MEINVLVKRLRPIFGKMPVIMKASISILLLDLFQAP
jgi:hypothetical protein